MQSAIDTINKIIDSIDILIANDQEMTSLILLYSGIDIVSSFLVNGKGNTSKKHFIEWTNKYLIPKLDYKCTAEDLYAARCAVVHTMRSESNLSVTNKAKQIYYEWGSIRSVNQENLINSIDFNLKGIILLQGEELVDAFESAFQEFIIEKKDDLNFVDNFNQRSLKMFVEFE
jgi:predicted acyltransferase (DUF342 family)